MGTGIEARIWELDDIAKLMKIGKCVKQLKIAGIIVLVLWAVWVTQRLGEFQRLALNACSAARSANVVVEAEHSHPTTVAFSSSGCDYGYVLWWMSPRARSSRPYQTTSPDPIKFARSVASGVTCARQPKAVPLGNPDVRA